MCSVHLNVAAEYDVPGQRGKRFVGHQGAEALVFTRRVEWVTRSIMAQMLGGYVGVAERSFVLRERIDGGFERRWCDRGRNGHA